MKRFLVLVALVLVGCGDDDGMMPCEGAECPCEDCPDHCTNMSADGDETDVDCGGSCNGCVEGLACIENMDCASGACSRTLGVCVPSHCSNDTVDEDESDIDCGGSCGGCAPGLVCNEGTDCEFGVCGVASTCLPFECVDGEIGGGETDLDCGGGVCDPCPPDRMCIENDDCLELVCDDGTCLFPECDDGVQNGVEEAVDCGGFCVPCHCTSGEVDGDEVDVDCGGSCDACAVGQACTDFEDCASGICGRDSVCLEAHCGNAMEDGSETDTDCGGDCDPCGADARCMLNDDCDSGFCDGGLCAPPTCEDGLMNGDETGVDCGGSCPLACSCSDSVENGSETDVDCGGDCLPCADGMGCAIAMDCESDICADAICRPTFCIDGSQNGSETDVDCGGECPPCGPGDSCAMPSDCSTMICVGDLCASASCSDGIQNGFESAVDCGGVCDACTAGMSCIVDLDCESRRCTASSCAMAACDDGLLNGDETGVDCGGSCDACVPAHCSNGSTDGDELAMDCGGSCAGCAAGTTCTDDDDCASGRCTGTCTAPSCSDGFQADSETDVDCGGSCPACDDGLGCRVDTDCSTGRCDGTCLAGPLASFTLTRDGGAALAVVAESHAREGDRSIADTWWDWGEGGGYETDSSHVYASAGMYTVTQLVRDTSGIEVTARKRIRVRDFDARLDPASATGPIRFERDDLTFLFDSTFAVGAARSDVAITPGSGVYYVEGTWLTDTQGDFGFGVATDAFTLGDFLGSDDQGLNVSAQGSVFYDGVYQGGTRPPDQAAIGIVIDYRGASPIAHVIQSATEAPISVMMTGITTDLYLVASGARSAIGGLMELNTGFDTTNYPFLYDVATVLADNSIAAPGLVLGWTGTGSFAADEAPNVTGVATVSTAMGTPVLLDATAMDASDGDLTHSLRWENTTDTFNDRIVGYGPNFLFDPPTPGIHYVRAWTYDAEGQLGEHTIRVDVSGALTRFDDVLLVTEPTTGEGIVVSTEGLRARFTTARKSGIRANQAILDGFHYFEATRLGAITAQGVGIVTPFGDLDPYAEAIVPWSVSAQVLGGLWRNFIRVADWDNGETAIGVAVDYRGEYPIVYFIVNDTVELEIHMTEITVPVHPILYGQPPSFSGWQWQVNFGTDAFSNDAVGALTTHGVADAASLTLSWGR